MLRLQGAHVPGDQRQLPARHVEPLEDTLRVETAQGIHFLRRDPPEAELVRHRVHHGHEPRKAVRSVPSMSKMTSRYFKRDPGSRRSCQATSAATAARQVSIALISSPLLNGLHRQSAAPRSRALWKKSGIDSPRTA